jgi:hypothetical protein
VVEFDRQRQLARRDHRPGGRHETPGLRGGDRRPLSTHEWGGTYEGFLASTYAFTSDWTQHDGAEPEGAAENQWSFSVGWDGTHSDNWGQSFAFSGGDTSSGVNTAPSGETSYLSNVPGYDASLLGSYVPSVPTGWAPSAPPQHPPGTVQIVAPPFVLGGGDEGGNGGEDDGQRTEPPGGWESPAWDAAAAFGSSLWSGAGNLLYTPVRMAKGVGELGLMAGDTLGILGAGMFGARWESWSSVGQAMENGQLTAGDFYENLLKNVVTFGGWDAGEAISQWANGDIGDGELRDRLNNFAAGLLIWAGVLKVRAIISSPKPNSTIAPSNLLAGSSLTKADLLKAASVPDRGGLTAAGRSLTKHGSGARPGNTLFPGATGNPAAINQQAKAIVDEILNNPATKFTDGFRGRFGKTIEAVAPDGRGIVFDANGKFLFFKE